MKKIASLLMLLALGLSLSAENPTLDLKVSGMHCSSCENKFKAAATKISGIEEVTAVSASSGTATIRYNPSEISAEKAIQSLAEATGYTVTGTTNLGVVQSEGKPAGCCSKGQSNPACKKTEKTCKGQKEGE